MRATSLKEDPARDSVVNVTTDELVGPEAETHLASDYDLALLQTWDELAALVRKHVPSAIVVDLDTVGESSEDGITALNELRAMGPDLVLVGLTRSNSRNLRLKATGATGDEYFVAAVNFEEIRAALGRALEKKALEVEWRNRQNEEVERQSFCELIGSSEPMQRVYEAVRRLADSNSTVLIRGESGTGKELVARAVVSLGARSEKPFISIN